MVLAILAILAVLATSTPLGAATEAAGSATSPLVRSFHIKGNRWVSTALIKAELLSPRPSLLPWKRPPVLDTDDLENDVNRVVALYRRQGFYHAEVTTEIEHRGEEEVVISLHITEGPGVKVDSVTLTLAEPESGVRLQPFLQDSPLKIGQRFTEPAYEDLKKNILNHLLDNGYPQARVDGEVLVDAKKNRASVVVQAWPGPLCSFGPISIQGERQTPEALIRRQLTFAPGELFSYAKLYQSQEKLYDLDLFQTVTLTPLEVGAEEREIPIVIAVAEKKKRSFKVGLGYGSEDEFRARGVLRYRNLGGGGRVLELNTKYSRLETRLEGSFLNPLILGSDNDLAATAGFIRRYLPGFTDKAVYSRAILERRLFWDMKGYVGHGLEFARPFNIAPETLVLLNATEPGKLYTASMLIWGLSRNTVDNPIDPQKGSSLSLAGDYAPEIFGSNLQFVRTVVEAKHYQGLGLKNVVLAGRVKFGVIEPTERTREIPIYRRFFSGGSTSVRGYRLDYLGPRNLSGDPIGGNAVMEGNLELRFPLYKNFRAVAFIDGGNVFLKNEDIDPGQLKYGSGFGLRYQTPIGPVGVDVAFPLNPINPAKDKYQIYFTIGQAF